MPPSPSSSYHHLSDQQPHESTSRPRPLSNTFSHSRRPDFHTSPSSPAVPQTRQQDRSQRLPDFDLGRSDFDPSSLGRGSVSGSGARRPSITHSASASRISSLARSAAPQPLHIDPFPPKGLGSSYPGQRNSYASPTHRSPPSPGLGSTPPHAMSSSPPNQNSLASYRPGPGPSSSREGGYGAGSASVGNGNWTRDQGDGTGRDRDRAAGRDARTTYGDRDGSLRHEHSSNALRERRSGGLSSPPPASSSAFSSAAGINAANSSSLSRRSAVLAPLHTGGSTDRQPSPRTSPSGQHDKRFSQPLFVRPEALNRTSSSQGHSPSNESSASSPGRGGGLLPPQNLASDRRSPSAPPPSPGDAGRAGEATNPHASAGQTPVPVSSSSAPSSSIAVAGTSSTPNAISATSSGSSRSAQPCAKCGQPMSGQFVRALGTVFHLDCFRCQDCSKVVAAKFFPVDGLDGKQYPLCETDYFRRLNLLCANCGGALRGSYITALNMKYHVEHFTCSVCPTVFGSHDSYYEHAGNVYCHFHYSTRFAVKCTGCSTAILKQFVEINRNSVDEHWHPECYMIHKFWNIKLRKSQPAPPLPAGTPQQAALPAASSASLPGAPSTVSSSALVPSGNESTDALSASGDPSSSAPTSAKPAGPIMAEDYQEQEARETPQSLREKQRTMEEQVYRIWTVLSTFEESSAACISEMLRHVSIGNYLDSVRMAEKFVLHVETLFAAIDELGAHFRTVGAKEISHVREARLLCKKIVNFFSLLSHTHETGPRKMGITQELLSLVTGLAHYLKILIRIALTAALKLERDHQNRTAIGVFLNKLDRLARDPDASRPSPLPATNGSSNPISPKPRAYGYKSLTRAVGTLVGQGEATTDLCEGCKQTVEEECARYGTSFRWHLGCLRCSNCRRPSCKEKNPPPPAPPSTDGQPPGQPQPPSGPPPMYLKQFRVELREPRAEDPVVNGQPRPRPGRTYCANCAPQPARDGFEYASRLEQYAFLLCVALNKLYAQLKQRGVVPSEPFSPTSEGDDRSILETYRDSNDIKRMKSVNLDRKVSTTARIAKRSMVVESPSGRVAQPNEPGHPGTPKSPEARPGGRQQHQPMPPLPGPSAQRQGPGPGLQERASAGNLQQPRERDSRDRPPQRPEPPRPSQQQSSYPSSPRPPNPEGIISPIPTRPNLDRSTTAIRIVDDQPGEYTAGGREEAHFLGSEKSPLNRDEDGITLADLPMMMQAEQARVQQRNSINKPTSGVLISELSALEFLILKHVAALSIASEGSQLKDVCTLDELMEIIDAKKNTFWGKLFKGGADKKNVKKKGVFGIPLETLVERQGADSMHGAGPAPVRVPSFIDDCISAMKQMDMSIEGVFRKNGNIRRLKELSDALDKDPSQVNLSDDNPVQLAALLKKFLRELPDPLLTHKLHGLFIATQRIDSELERKRMLHTVCCLMPKFHRDTMEVLFVFLKWVASFSHIDEETGSKMDLQNLATVICPNILVSKSKDASRDESFLSIRAVSELLEYQDEFWLVPDEFSAILQDQELFANPTELTPKDVLKRCENWVRTRRASQGRGGLSSPVEGPGSGFRRDGAVHAHRGDVHQGPPGGIEQARGIHATFANDRSGGYYPQQAPPSPGQKNFSTPLPNLASPRSNLSDQGHASPYGPDGSNDFRRTPPDTLQRQQA